MSEKSLKTIHTTMENKPIYPKVQIVEFEDRIEFKTYVRKKHRGRYYQTVVHQKWQLTNKDLNNVLNCLQAFNNEVYKIQILGKVDFNVKDMHGKPLYRPDTDTRSEEDRLKSMLPVEIKPKVIKNWTAGS